MTQIECLEIINAGQRAGSPEAELEVRIAQLRQRRSKLSDDEVVLLRKVVFHQIVREHNDLVSKLLRRWDLGRAERDDLWQETFLTLHRSIVERGFPDSIPGMLDSIVEGKVLNYWHVTGRAPFSVGVTSSIEEKPRISFDLDRTLDLRRLARRIVPQLSPEHQQVIKEVVVNGLTHIEAAAALGIPEGTLKSRLLSATRALFVLAAPLLPPSQRGLR